MIEHSAKEALILFVLGIYEIFAYSFLIMLFWGWFLIPIFKNLPTIGFGAAVGLGILATFLRDDWAHDLVYEKDPNHANFYKLVRPLFYLLVGSIVQLILVNS